MLLKVGGEEKVVPLPGRNEGSEKLMKSEDDVADGILLALDNRRPRRKKNRNIYRQNNSKETR